MKKSFLFYLLLFLIPCTSQAVVITFDDVTVAASDFISAGYQGLNWEGYDPQSSVVGASVPVSTDKNATVSCAYSLGSTLGFQISRLDGMHSMSWTFTLPSRAPG
jgi:hypothetical protein